jgi:glucosamine-phosphate N-acetyltransferase
MSSFTPDNELDLLFPSELISSEVKAQLGPDLHVKRVLMNYAYHH